MGPVRKLGPLMYAEDEGVLFLGRGGGGQRRSFSGRDSQADRLEVRSIIDQCYGTAKRILTETATSWMPWLMPDEMRNHRCRSDRRHHGGSYTASAA